MTGKDDAVIQDHVQKRILKEATDWLILLQEDPQDHALHAQFDEWLNQNPHHGQAWQSIQKTAGLMACIPPQPDSDWQKYLDQSRASRTENALGQQNAIVDASSRFTRKKASRLRKYVLVGAAIAATLVIAVMAPDLITRMQADYRTGSGEIETVSLADGSQVVLAPETAIRVKFEAGKRHVTLLNGEAFFEVTHNPDRPFQVRSDAVNVTVLGTGFDVSDNIGSTTVSVAHGLVQVDNMRVQPAISELLKSGQSARVGWAGGVKRHDVSKGDIAPWRRNQLIAQDQPLGEVVDQLRRYYSGKIVVTSNELSMHPVTGVYNLHNPVAALRGIARAQNATVREITPWLLVVSPS